MKRRALGMAAGVLTVTLPIALASGAQAKDRAKDRACTASDVRRFEMMFGGKGSYHSDPRFQLTLHYLGTTVSRGICHVQLRPAD